MLPMGRFVSPLDRSCICALGTYRRVSGLVAWQTLGRGDLCSSDDDLSFGIPNTRTERASAIAPPPQDSVLSIIVSWLDRLTLDT
jgi:hypothetical protein